MSGGRESLQSCSSGLKEPLLRCHASFLGQSCSQSMSVGVKLLLLCWSSGLGELMQRHLLVSEQLLQSDCLKRAQEADAAAPHYGALTGSLPCRCCRRGEALQNFICALANALTMGTSGR